MGIRCEDAQTLSLNSILERNGEILLKIDGKGGLRWDILCDTETRKNLQEFQQIREAYLSEKGKAISGSLLGCKGRQLERIIEKLGEQVGCSMHLEPHLLRRSSVSRCVNALDDLALLPVVAEKYGHTVQVLLRHYFKSSKENQVLIDTRMKYTA